MDQTPTPTWIGIHTPGESPVNRNLLCRLDPDRLLLEFVKRRRKTIVDLLEYLDIETLKRIVRAHEGQGLVYAGEVESQEHASS